MTEESGTDASSPLSTLSEGLVEELGAMDWEFSAPLEPTTEEAGSIASSPLSELTEEAVDELEAMNLKERRHY